ncbi:MAG: L-seryl-tRNA(Sec) selenium transferase [bacterium]|nr:L-seryl-tRNA(Sec) selenium transferase [bacterium]
MQPTLKRVVNCTGVVLHTNLGRAPLGADILERAAEIIAGYTNLEFTLETGKRGHRDALITDLLRETTGAEAAVVVNNNAAAVMLVLRTFARGRSAAVSRGQLIEIGGSFRLPDVMEAGGVELDAVGSVNRCRADDFRTALDEGAAMILLAHKSNFTFTGEYEEPEFHELAKLAAEYGIPLAIDLGSGILDHSYFPNLDLGSELTVRQLLGEGVEIVTFSGDKLLGGPQAGIIVGSEKWVNVLKKDQMLRALRAGKETYALLSVVLGCFARGGEALNEIPTYRLLNRTADECRAIAKKLQKAWQGKLPDGAELDIADDVSLAGGGTLPGLRIPTTVLKLRIPGYKPAQLSTALRGLDPPVIVRSSGEYTVFDPRALLDDDIGLLKQTNISDIL